MIVSIHQPAYLPWLGYFDRILRSDLFIFLDTVQLETNSFTNRNRIKTAGGPLWLTIPVRSRGHMGRTLRDVEIDGTHWRNKHLKSIRQSYANAPFFVDRFPRLAATYETGTQNLADFCFDQLAFWLTELNIGTKVARASHLDVDGRKSQLVLDLCRTVGATTYLSGTLGRGYLEEKDFETAGIDVRYQDFRGVAYPQLFGDFVPNLAVVDYWLNTPDAQLNKDVA